ncbi:hypothetical protein [Neisseria polysaccharea]|nr:hypothetical protein [Neisseria polysaccharea]
MPSENGRPGICTKCSAPLPLLNYTSKHKQAESRFHNTIPFQLQETTK